MASALLYAAAMFSAWMALALATQSPTLRIAPERGCQAAAPNARFSPHFNKVSPEEIVQLISDVTCKTFILPENVQRLERLLTELDVERAPTDSLGVLPLRHASATDVSDKLSR